MQVGKRDEIDIDFLERWKKAFNFALGNDFFYHIIILKLSQNEIHINPSCNL